MSDSVIQNKMIDILHYFNCEIFNSCDSGNESHTSSFLSSLVGPGMMGRMDNAGIINVNSMFSYSVGVDERVDVCGKSLNYDQGKEFLMGTPFSPSIDTRTAASISSGDSSLSLASLELIFCQESGPGRVLMSGKISR
jgi:hypothetical protein